MRALTKVSAGPGLELVERPEPTAGPNDVKIRVLRAGLCGSQVFGMGMVRYVLKLEPMASADHATLVAAVAPTLQRYLTDPLT